MQRVDALYAGWAVRHDWFAPLLVLNVTAGEIRDRTQAWLALSRNTAIEEGFYA